MTAMAEPKRVVLPEVDHAVASLEVIGLDGQSTVYSPAQLEEFPTYEIETRTPWRDQPALFSGVLLSDVLARHDLLSASVIVVTAENEFTATFDRRAMTTAPILIATRVDGEAHSRRARGPIQFVIAEQDMTDSDAFDESHLVWMAMRIEASR
jgi:hypothetical protein